MGIRRTANRCDHCLLRRRLHRRRRARRLARRFFRRFCSSRLRVRTRLATALDRLNTQRGGILSHAAVIVGVLLGLHQYGAGVYIASAGERHEQLRHRFAERLLGGLRVR